MYSLTNVTCVKIMFSYGMHHEFQRYEIVTDNEDTYEGDPLALFFFCIAAFLLLVLKE